MAMFHSMTLTFCFDTDLSLSGVIQSVIKTDETREDFSFEYVPENNIYTVSYVERGYCQVSEVLSYAQSIAEARQEISFTMDVWVKNEGSGGNYTDSIIARYSQGVLWHVYYSTAEVYAPEVAAEIGYEERLVETDAAKLIIDEGTKEAFWEELSAFLPTTSLCSEIIKYDEKISFKLPPEYFIIKSYYDTGSICLVDDGTETEESFTCELRLLPLTQKIPNLEGNVKYFKLSSPSEVVVSAELIRGKKFDEWRSILEGYSITLKLDVLIPQSYYFEIKGRCFIYEGNSKELEQKCLADLGRMLDVYKAVRVNGEKIVFDDLTPELLKSVITPTPEGEPIAVDVSDKFLSTFQKEDLTTQGTATGVAKQKDSPEERNWLKEYGKYVEINPVIDFNGKIFVFSGLDAAGSFADKSNQVVLTVVSKGGIYRSKVSGKTNYLVVNPQYAGKTKVDEVLEQKAKGKDVRIIMLEDLLALL